MNAPIESQHHDRRNATAKEVVDISLSSDEEDSLHKLSNGKFSSKSSHKMKSNGKEEVVSGYNKETK